MSFLSVKMGVLKTRFLEKISHVDWKAVLLLVVICLVPLVIYWLEINPRVIGWQLAAIASAGLMYRLIGWFSVTPTGMRVMATLLILSLVLGAFGQYLLAYNPNAPVNWVTYALISQRLLCVVCAIYWPRWVDTTVSPFVKEKRT